MCVSVWWRLDNERATKRSERERVGGGLVLDAKGHLSGADDSVCVCVICAWLLVFACPF